MDGLLQSTDNKFAGFLVRVSNFALLRMCAKYNFQKPNDRRALDLMNTAAKAVVTDLPEIIIAYGVSDEYRLEFKLLQHGYMDSILTAKQFCHAQVM